MILYQFPFSHYCEKTRWNLDAKGVVHEVRDVAPGLHRVIAKRFRTPGTVPMLIDGDRAVGDSAAIAAYLEEHYPAHPLLPAGEGERRRVLDLQEKFDASYGPDSRQWVYGTMAQHGGGATSIWPAYYRGGTRAFVSATRRFIERPLRKMYRFSPENTKMARESLDAHFAELAELLGGRTDRYLVGESLTLADITAAALLAPAVVPAESPWANMDVPAPLAEMQRDFRNTIAGAWILERYRVDRRKRAH